MKLSNNNFTIYEVEEIQKDFLLLLNTNEIILDFENISKIDMSAIQLVISLKKSCDDLDKTFEIVNIKDEILNSLEITGIAYYLGV
jgi:anti-anti-sigma regulatory factor